MPQFRSSSSPSILLPTSTATPQIVHKNPMRAAAYISPRWQIYTQRVSLWKCVRQGNDTENDIDNTARSTHKSEERTEIDDDVSDADSHNRKNVHERDSRKTSYEIREKDASDQVLSVSRKALFTRWGEVIVLRGNSRKIGSFSFVGSKDTEEAAPVSFEVKTHSKRSGLIDDKKWTHAAAMPQTIWHAYVPSEEINPYMHR